MVDKCQFLLILLSLWNLISVVPLKVSIINTPILYMLCKGECMVALRNSMVIPCIRMGHV